MKKEIAVGIILVGIICIALFSGCIRETPKTEYTPPPTPTPKPTPDIRNIVITAENLNYDLWMIGKGGPYLQDKYITLTNNGDERVFLRVVCDGTDFLKENYYVGCGPRRRGITLEPYTKQIVGIRAYVGIQLPTSQYGESKASIPGEYSFVIARVELTDGYWKEYKTIAEFPVHIKVNDIRDQ